MQFKCINVRDDIINQILYDYEAKVVTIPKLEDKSYYDYRKNIIYIEETKEIICAGYIINSRCNTKYSSWVQIKCTPSTNTSKLTEDSIDGFTAWMQVLRVLAKHYTREEVVNTLKAFGDTKGDRLEQFHYTLRKVSQNVIKLPLCVKYDINGAHADAIAEMFPKATKDLVALYNKSKKYINFFVGMLKRHGYIGAYWHIVDRTTKTLLKAMDYVGGRLIYANTDGFCVQEPVHELQTSHILGEFKEEYKGTVYFIQNNIKSPYFLYQFGNDLKGNCMTEVRADIDLSQGHIVYYDRVSYGTYIKPENIIKETVQVYGEKEIK